jgi:SAM-dependent methyltransferase
MRQSVEFTRTLIIAYRRWSDGAIKDANVLDYGAGWGRLTRMLLQYVSDERVYACDAWQPSVDLYNGLGFRRLCDLVKTVPTTLPYEPERFDLVWMFSVLTHLPATAADAVMRELATVVRRGGLLVVTIRPLDFWRANPLVSGRVEPAVVVERHLRKGFAHIPHPTIPEWGDCSMSLDYMAERWPEWRILASEDNWTHQVKVFLQRPL